MTVTRFPPVIDGSETDLARAATTATGYVPDRPTLRVETVP